MKVFRSNVSFSIPALTFPGVTFSKTAIPWDLAVLLYPTCSGKNVRIAVELFDSGECGAPKLDRLPLVCAFHEALSGKLAAGIAKTSVGGAFTRLRQFVAHVDTFDLAFDLPSIERTFLHWTDHLVHRHRTKKDISENSAYGAAAMVSTLIDEILHRSSPLIALSRLRHRPVRPTAAGVQAEKQSLDATFKFGHMLSDVCGKLSKEVVLRGSLPVVIDVRSGGRIEHWSRWHKRKFDEGFQTFQAEGTLRTRSPLANLRIEAEILMFIGQTGMNFAQAIKLKLGRFRYASHIEGYQVREYKARRNGLVLFEIYKEYRPHFERYLRWRAELFPDADELFPFVNICGAFNFDQHTWRLREECKHLGISFVGPRSLRNTRVNWLLRRSSDPGLTAEMAQHTKETLLSVYEKPSLQRAGTEILRFWARHDPALAVTTPSVAPGECDGQPEAIEGIPAGATAPDCIRASGCLWCAHHRDIDDLDYVWALVCFGLVKEFEVNRRPPSQSIERSAAKCALDRICDKLRWLSGSNQKRLEWVEEAHARVEEGNYHPSWRRLIRQFQPV